MEKDEARLREKLLLVAGRRAHPAVLASYMSRSGFATTTVQDIPQALTAVARESPDLVICEPHDEISECELLCLALERNSFTAHIPVIVLAPPDPDQGRVRWFIHGADMCLDVPYQPDELLARARSLLVRSENRDSLTGLPSIGFFDKHLDSWLASGRETAVLYIDIDHFLPFVRVFGQAAGDNVISQLAKVIIGVIPTGDAEVTRRGPDQFLAMLPRESEPTVASTLVERFRAIRHEFYPPSYAARPKALGRRLAREGKGPPLTLSVALVTNEKHTLLSYVQMSALLDDAMKRAKAQGGDQCVIG